MRHTKIIVTALIIASLAFISNCKKTEDPENTPTNQTIDISGKWEGRLILDANDSSRTADTTYILNIIQDGKKLSAELTIPAEFGFTSVIQLKGAFDEDSTLIMSGIADSTEITVYGTVQGMHIMGLAVEGVESIVQYIEVYHSDIIYSSVIDNNEYIINLKLGVQGQGRSIILVHGLNDNIASWDIMLKYFKDHDIDVSNNVWVFEYQWSKGIDHSGQRMFDIISDKQSLNEISQDPIIVAHSMGGLVSRSYVSKGGDLHRLVTLATPHLGSDLGDYIGFTYDGVRDLRPGQKFLNDLFADSLDKAHRSHYWLLNGKIGTYKSCCKTILSHHICVCYQWHSPKPQFLERRGHSILMHHDKGQSNDGMVSHGSARFSGNHKYSGDPDVNRVSTFEWVNHKNMNKENAICIWVKDFIVNHN